MKPDPVWVARLVRVLGMMGSEHDGEALAAARAAERTRREKGLTWADIVKKTAGTTSGAAAPPKPPPRPKPQPSPRPRPEARPRQDHGWTPPPGHHERWQFFDIDNFGPEHDADLAAVGEHAAELASMLLKVHSIQWSDAETAFLRAMTRWRRQPTRRQCAWLALLWVRFLDRKKETAEHAGAEEATV